MTTSIVTTWEVCLKCGCVCRHDNGLCIRDTRHHRADRIGHSERFEHTPETPSYRARRGWVGEVGS